MKLVQDLHLLCCCCIHCCRKYACTAQVTVTTSSGVPVPGVAVTGIYTTRYAATGFPTAYYTATTGSNGVATMPTAPWAYRSAYSETFTVTAAMKSGYSMTNAPTYTVTF